MRQNTVSRRGFNSGAAAVAFGAMVVPRRVLGGAGYLPPSETVNFALVGCGGQGASDATEMVSGGQNLVALTDVDFGFVDSTMAGRGKGRNGQRNAEGVKLQEAYGKAKRFADYRKMLEESKDIDGVVVATPDHTHGVIAKAAMELGKHVYVEKPLTWSVHEARVLRETAQRHQGRDPDGQPGSFQRGCRADQRMDSRRRDRPRERGPCLDQSPDLAAGHSAPGKAHRRPGRDARWWRLWTKMEFATAELDDRVGHRRRRDPTARP